MAAVAAESGRRGERVLRHGEGVGVAGEQIGRRGDKIAVASIFAKTLV